MNSLDYVDQNILSDGVILTLLRDNVYGSKLKEVEKSIYNLDHL